MKTNEFLYLLFVSTAEWLKRMKTFFFKGRKQFESQDKQDAYDIVNLLTLIIYFTGILVNFVDI